jgi:hypothetical protein
MLGLHKAGQDYKTCKAGLNCCDLKSYTGLLDFEKKVAMTA